MKKLSNQLVVNNIKKFVVICAHKNEVNQNQQQNDYKEAIKTRRLLCSNAQNLEQFDSDLEYANRKILAKRIKNVRKSNKCNHCDYASVSASTYTFEKSLWRKTVQKLPM